MIKDELVWKFNSTMKIAENGYRKNYVIKKYEELLEEEKKKSDDDDKKKVPKAKAKPKKKGCC